MCSASTHNQAYKSSCDKRISLTSSQAKQTVCSSPHSQCPSTPGNRRSIEPLVRLPCSYSNSSCNQDKPPRPVQPRRFRLSDSLRLDVCRVGLPSPPSESQRRYACAPKHARIAKGEFYTVINLQRDNLERRTGCMLSRQKLDGDFCGQGHPPRSLARSRDRSADPLTGRLLPPASPCRH